IPLDESWNRQQVEKVAGVIGAVVGKTAAVRPISVNTVPSNGTHAKRTADGERTAIGIIGCGQMGQWHLNSYKKNASCHVAAVADTDFGKAEAFAAQVGARAYRSHAEMIRKESLAGISVCTLPATHKDIVMDVLHAGVHVLCEKPLTISVEQA